MSIIKLLWKVLQSHKKEAIGFVLNLTPIERRKEENRIKTMCLFFGEYSGNLFSIKSHCHMDDLEGWSVGLNDASWENRRDGLTLDEAIEMFQMAEKKKVAVLIPR